MSEFDWSTVGRSAGGTSTNTSQRTSGGVFDLIDPANARRLISGLLPGGRTSSVTGQTNIGFQNISGSGSASGISEDDWRVRVSLGDTSTIFYKDPSQREGILSPLIETNGVIWPYTPQITLTHMAQYTSVPLTHSNYPVNFYNSSDVSDINISGEFTVQSYDEGQYLLAAVYFFRACTKMFFGQGADAGNPPPMVFLNGYGSHYLPNIPCVVTSFAHTLPADVDYISVPITSAKLSETEVPGEAGFTEDIFSGTSSPIRSGDTTSFVELQGRVTNFGSEARTVNTISTLTSATRLPTISTITITLKPMYSRKHLSERFSLKDFAAGLLLQDRDRGYGGII